MSRLQLWRQWREWRERRRFEAEMKEEMAYHLDRKTADHRAAGLSKREARRQAHLDFGNVTATQESCREPWLFASWDALKQDLRFGTRWLVRNPLLTLAVIATLSLGVGANTAVFSVVRALLFDSPSVAEPEQVFFVGESASMGMRVNPNVRDTTLFSYPFYDRLQERSGQLEGLAAQSSFPNRVYWKPSKGEVKRVQGRLVSGNFFPLLGVRAAMGRTLVPEDDEQPGVRAVAVVSHGFWVRELGQSPQVVGRELILNDRSFTVVGVAEEGFRGVDAGGMTDVWFPLMMETAVMGSSAISVGSLLEASDFMWIRLVARLPKGAKASTLETELSALFRQIASFELGGQLTSETARELDRQQLTLTPLGQGPSELRMQFGQPIKVLMVVVLLVLLIACANIGTLLLARAAARQREMAARSALGAPRGRLVRQLLTESSLLALLGGVGGVLLASMVGPALARFLSRGSESTLLETKLDPSVLVFTLVVCVLAVVAFGLAPALFASRSSHGSSPLGQGRSASGLSAKRGLGRALVVTQVVLSLVLLTGAGLFLRTFQNLRSWDTGMGPGSAWVASLDTAALGAEPEDLPALYQQFRQAVEEIAVVDSTGLSWAGFFTGMYWTDRAGVDGRELDPEDTRTELDTIYGSVFESLGVELLQGREFDSRDTAQAPQVVIVNQTFARQILGDGPVLGRRIGFDGGEGPREIEIVGLVADFQSQSLGQEVGPRAFFPGSQDLRPMSAMVIRTAGAARDLPRQIRRHLLAVAPGLPVSEIVPMETRIDEVLDQERLISSLSLLFGVLALTLAAIGLYAVLAYGVNRRRAEFGLRLALGAQRQEIGRVVLVDAVRVLVAGLALGLPLAWLAQRLVSHLLFGLESGDPLVYAAATAVLLVVILAASWLPARRAARTDPILALRQE
ncbi:MAG: ABC transporter permease [Deltaproteobacteria bacterium]|nr:ABC transporter permease [Deltaproteobacteria bacterium]